MGGKNRDVNIYVEPDTSKPGKYLFSMDEGFGATEELKFDKSEDGMWKWENYKINFHLNNRKGANLKFSKIKSKVLWAEETSLPDPPCPTSQTLDGIFYVAKDSDMKDDRLTVTNSDRDRLRFAFGFNFLQADEQEGPGTNYVLYDPIGTNQNGGWPRSFAMIAPATVGGAAVGAVAGIVAAPRLSPAATTATYAWGAVIGAIVGYAVGLVLAKPPAQGSTPHA